MMQRAHEVTEVWQVDHSPRPGKLTGITAVRNMRFITFLLFIVCNSVDCICSAKLQLCTYLLKADEVFGSS